MFKHVLEHAAEIHRVVDLYKRAGAISNERMWSDWAKSYCIVYSSDKLNKKPLTPEDHALHGQVMRDLRTLSRGPG